MPAIPPQLHCRRLPPFDARRLDLSLAAFAQAQGCGMQQAWLPAVETGFTPAMARVGQRGNSVAVFAELEDADIFTRARALNQRMWELGDVLEIFLSPEHSASYVEFHVTPNNHRLQLRFPNTQALRYAQQANSFDAFLLTGPVFHSQTWVEGEKWFVYAEIPSMQVCVGDVPLAGARWRFSFSRYDFIRGRHEPIISSTSPHAQPDFHRREEWGVLHFV